MFANYLKTAYRNLLRHRGHTLISVAGLALGMACCLLIVGIGIRKVLGASVAGIVGLLSKDFLKLVLIAFVLATPLAYVGVQQWLERFAYRIDIGPGIFLITVAIVLLIAIVTVSYQSIRAAVSDPVKSLRYE